MLIDLGVHVFDTLRYLLGDPLEQVVSAAAQESGGCDDHACLLLRYRAGTMATIHVSWRDTGYHNTVYLFGEKGTLAINLAKGEPLVLENRSHPGPTYPPLTPDCFKPTLYDHFLDCILKGLIPETSGRVGAEALSSVRAAYRSVQSGRPERPRRVRG